MAVSNLKLKKTFVEDLLLDKYPKFSEYIGTKVYNLIKNYLLTHKDKMIWAIEDLEKPPLEGIGKKLVQLNVDFSDPNIRRLTGALIAVILSDSYEPDSSGWRVSWRPFITSSKYRKIVK